VRPIAVDEAKIRNIPVTANLHMKYTRFNKIVLMASRLEKEKNIELAIRAWAEVLRTFGEAGLIIVGKGREKDRLAELARACGVSDSVKFEEWADLPTLVSYYKTADLFLNTSLYEGYGMTLVEARAAGTKIVSTDVGVAKEMGASIIDWSTEAAARGIIEGLS
jgi:1,2-diacylglycerol 3-alpha-glucosyltransferase